MTAHVPDAGDAPRARRKVGPLELFVGFASMAVVGFGGVGPWTRWMLVDRRAWFTDAEFLNLYALANFLPGGNVLNIAVLAGARLAGLPGAVAALLGLVGPPALIVTALAGLYHAYGHLPAVQSTVDAVAAAAAGLIVAMGLRLAYPLRSSPRALAVLAAVLFAVLVLRMPLVWMLILILPASLVAARVARR
jgi:chromate transporter